MLTRPLTLTESDDRGRGLSAMTPPPALPLADEADDEETQTGVFSPPAPPWSSSSSSSSPPPPAPLSVSAPFMTPPSVNNFFLPPPSSSAPPAPPSFHPSPPFELPHNSVHFPPASVSFSPPPPAPPLLYHRSSCDISPPVPPPVFFTPFASTICSPLSSSSPPVAPSLPSPPAVSPHLPAAPPPPCCPCSSLLPRLLSAHRLEVRRLLRGALASLGRRLDSLERRSRRRRRRMEKRSRVPAEEEEGSAFSSGSGAVPCSPATSCSPAHRPSVTSSSSSSSDGEDAPPSFSLSQSEQSRRGRKRRRKSHRRREMSIFPEIREAEEEEEEEDAGRFVGRMAFSFRGGGAEEEAPLVLHKFNHRKHRRREGVETGQSEKAVSVVRRNGYRALHGSSSQHALQLEPLARSQSEALAVSSGQWRFCDVPFSTNHSALHIWQLSPASSTFSPAPILRLSAVAVETLSEAVRGGACWRPLRRLKDWTAPPSLSSDHCYVRTPIPSFSARRQQKQRANHSSRSLHLPRRRPLPPPLCSTNRLSALLSVSQSAESSEFLSPNGERGKRVSQIRIRRASPRETPLTPMGLPKVKRLKKKEFSLEEIYTNKNYKSPTTNRSLETIFEEPREKDGALLLIGQQRRRRLLLFPDFTQPRKRKRQQGAGLPVSMAPRKRAAARRHCHGDGSDDSDLDVMLVERLSALEDFLTRQGLDV